MNEKMMGSQGTPEEIKKAEEMMTDQEKWSSKDREWDQIFSQGKTEKITKLSQEPNEKASEEIQDYYKQIVRGFWERGKSSSGDRIIGPKKLGIPPTPETVDFVDKYIEEQFNDLSENADKEKWCDEFLVTMIGGNYHYRAKLVSDYLDQKITLPEKLKEKIFKKIKKVGDWYTAEDLKEIGITPSPELEVDPIECESGVYLNAVNDFNRKGPSDLKALRIIRVYSDKRKRPNGGNFQSLNPKPENKNWVIENLVSEINSSIQYDKLQFKEDVVDKKIGHVLNDHIVEIIGPAPKDVLEEIKKRIEKK